MSNKNDGGPAFPILPRVSRTATDGMSLRDYFAAQAMAAFITSPRTLNGERDISAEKYAAGAFAMADAMLAERQK